MDLRDKKKTLKKCNYCDKLKIWRKKIGSKEEENSIKLKVIKWEIDTQTGLKNNSHLQQHKKHLVANKK